MSGKNVKRIRRLIRKNSNKIQVEAYKQFIALGQELGFFARLQFCFRFLFNRIEVK
jgi:hypothetical protein